MWNHNSFEMRPSLAWSETCHKPLFHPCGFSTTLQTQGGPAAAPPQDPNVPQNPTTKQLVPATFICVLHLLQTFPLRKRSAAKVFFHLLF